MFFPFFFHYFISLFALFVLFLCFMYVFSFNVSGLLARELYYVVPAVATMLCLP